MVNPWEYRFKKENHMKMFLGEYQPNITEGSRISLPKKLRDQIEGDDVILSKGFERCIFVYDKEDWLNEAQKQVENPITDSKTRELKRYMFSGASETTIDSQGRIVLPGNLKDYAKIDKKAVVIGAGDHIEIWDLDTWGDYSQRISQILSA
jgi:MraZ protein